MSWRRRPERVVECRGREVAVCEDGGAGERLQAAPATPMCARHAAHRRDECSDRPAQDTIPPAGRADRPRSVPERADTRAERPARRCVPPRQCSLPPARAMKDQHQHGVAANASWIVGNHKGASPTARACRMTSAKRRVPDRQSRLTATQSRLCDARSARRCRRAGLHALQGVGRRDQSPDESAKTCPRQ
jgi:hypothetical protein